jgi:hypothetical protein
MTVPVDIFVTSDETLPAPIVGAVVTVLDPFLNLNLMAQATTDANGQASMVLPGEADPGRIFEVRLFKVGVIFGSPKRVAVLEPATLPNRFDVTGTLTILPVATDPRVCRCTGRFLNFSNQPIAGATLRISSKAESGLEVPKLVDSNMVSSETMEFKTNSYGFVTVDLHRGGEYYVKFSGSDDRIWNIKVPDRSSVNLIDLIHPAPVRLDWDPTVAPGAAVSLNVDEALAVPLSLLFSDYEVMTAGLNSWMLLTSSDPTKVQVVLSQDCAYIRGIAAGTAQITASCPKGIAPVRVPDYAIASPPLTVTVTTPP